jgi:hypothetical protein
MANDRPLPSLPTSEPLRASEREELALSLRRAKRYLNTKSFGYVEVTWLQFVVPKPLMRTRLHVYGADCRFGAGEERTMSFVVGNGWKVAPVP